MADQQRSVVDYQQHGHADPQRYRGDSRDVQVAQSHQQPRPSTNLAKFVFCYTML